jgi:hypothetical protein
MAWANACQSSASNTTFSRALWRAAAEQAVLDWMRHLETPT